jgi:hypothetical protein
MKRKKIFLVIFLNQSLKQIEINSKNLLFRILHFIIINFNTLHKQIEEFLII